MTKEADRGGITGDPPVMFHHSRCTSLNGIAALDYDQSHEPADRADHNSDLSYCSNCIMECSVLMSLADSPAAPVRQTQVWYRVTAIDYEKPPGARPQTLVVLPVPALLPSNVCQDWHLMWGATVVGPTPAMADSSHTSCCQQSVQPLQLPLHKHQGETAHHVLGHFRHGKIAEIRAAH